MDIESMLARQTHQAKFSHIFRQFSPSFPIFCPWVGDPLLFENGYCDASFALGIGHIWIFFSPNFTKFQASCCEPTRSEAA